MQAISSFIKENKKLAFIFLGFLMFFVIAFIILFIVKGCSGSSETYSELEKSMVEESLRYFKDNNSLPKEEGNEVKITLNELIEKKYIKSFDKFEDGTCSGEVVIKKNGDSYTSYPNLDCKEEYHTQVLSNILINNLVKTGNGLYKMGDIYVFRGEYVDNYVSFANNTWRIVSLDENKNIKLVQVLKQNSEGFEWDDRYNNSKEDEVGINKYELSRIREHLNEFYNSSDNFDSNSKGHLIAYDVCIGKRKKTDTEISLEKDCSAKLKNQFIGLLNYSEYYMASLDSECKKTSDGSCENYNYLDETAYRTWTTNSVSDNNYEALVSGVGASMCYNYRKSPAVIKLSSKELVCSGSGTEENPYIIKTEKTC